MNEKDYFIHLIYCYINDTTPKGVKNIDYNEIYNIAKKHNVVPMLATEIDKLPSKFKPNKELMKKFDDALVQNNKNYQFKMTALTAFLSSLTKAKIPHLLVKGAVLRNIYPNPELRCSVDTDVIIKPTSFFRAIDALRNDGFLVDISNNSVAVAKLGSEVFEVNTELENINIQSKIYFSTPFDDISEKSMYTYKLKPLYHLLYVITHIAHHLKIGGVGIRMIMDIDAIIRNYPNINIKKFLEICDNIKIGYMAKILIALSKKWFKTPVAIDFTFEDEENNKIYDCITQAIFDREKLYDYLENNQKMTFKDKFLSLFKSKDKEENNEAFERLKQEIIKELEIS